MSDVGEAVCKTCPRHCRLADGAIGFCRARRAEDGRVVAANYGQISSLALDPIEKKPIAFFHPGSNILSIGSYGCNLRCPFCQNDGISQHGVDEVPCRVATPVELADLAARLKDDQGNMVAVADDEARFRPDPVLEFTPFKEGVYSLAIHDVLYRGRADFVYTIHIGDAKKPAARAADGVVSRPGMVSTKKFSIAKPGPHVLEVKARRKGSPLDAVLTLRKAAGGPVLGYWDDVTNTVFTGTVPQGECDPIGTYDFKEAGEYLAEVTDRTGHGGDDYVWWLEVRSPTPDFEAFSTRSTLPMMAGRPVKVGFRVRRTDGFTGNVKLEFPQDIRVQNGVITSGVDTTFAMLTYVGQRTMEVQPIKVFASATIGGKTVRHPVMPCDEYEQAFAWKHLVPAEEFLFRGIPPPKKQVKRGFESIKRPPDHKPNPGKCTNCHAEKWLRERL